MSFYTDASLVLIPSGIKDQKVYCAKPVDGLIGRFDSSPAVTRHRLDPLLMSGIIHTQILLQLVC
jgi:hypothetical protein